MPSRIKALFLNAYADARVNRRAVRIYSRLHPPPYRRANMEFDFDVWHGISSLRASNGRQLGENNTTPGIYRELVDTEHKVAKFTGSRQGRNINMTALRNVLPVWDDALQLTRLLRDSYIQHHGLAAGAAMNPCQGYAFSKVAAAYVAFLARRRDAPLQDGAVTPVVAGFFTLGVGPFIVVRALMEQGDTAALQTSPLSGPAWYDLAERSGSLLAGTDRACAGSKAMITQYLDASMNGAHDKPVTSSEARAAFESIDDWDRFYRYFYASSRLELIVKLSQALMAQWLIGLHAAAVPATAEGRSLLQECLAVCLNRAPSPIGERALLARYASIALALLDELKLPDVAVALRALGGTDDVGEIDVSAGGLATALQRMRSIIETLYGHGRAELDALNAALQWPAPGRVSLDNFYTRVAGAQIKPLMALLERSIAAGGTRAARESASSQL